MADTNIKISLELADKAAQAALGEFIKKTSSADKGLDKLKNSASNTFNEISVGIGKSIGIYDIFAGNLAANVVLQSLDSLASAARAMFDTFIVDGVEGAKAAEEALNSLNFALAQAGQFTPEASRAIQDFAEELQATTAFEDDLIIKNAALIESLAQLDTNGLKRATPAALDLAAGLAGKGLSVEAASEALGKAANGNVTQLQRLGIEIQKGRTDAETFANALAAVEARFAGAAASKLNTYAGAVSQATNAFGNLTEEIGNLIVNNPAVIAVVNEAGKIFTEFSAIVKDNNNSLLIIVAQGLSQFLEIGAFVITAIDGMIRAFQFLTGVTQALLFPIVGLGAVFRSFTEGVDSAANRVKAFEASATKNLNAFGAEGDGALAKIAENLLRMRDAAEKGNFALENGFQKSVDPINRTGGAVKAMSEEVEKAQSRLKSFAEDLIKQAENGAVSTETALQLARNQAEEEQRILDEKLANQLISYSEYQAQRDAIDTQYDATRNELATAALAEDQAKLDAAFQQKLISEQQYQTASQQLQAGFDKEKAKRDGEIAKREAEQKKQQLALEKTYNQAKLQATADVFGAVADIAALGGKKNFEIVKAFNLAEAITAGILSIQKAAASAPPPFNVPAIVSASVLSAANVARIASTKAPSFEDGGIVPGTSFTGDRVSANVNSGEMILNRQQQKTLFQMANGAGLGAGVEAKIDQLIGLLAGKDEQIVVNIGGKTVVDTLRSELAAGRSFA